MDMIECSVKTELNGKTFTYRYGVLVDSYDARPIRIHRQRQIRREPKCG